MGFKVILTPQSLDDLRETVSFIAQDNPERARSFGNELIDRALTLAELPERGRVVPGGAGNFRAKRPRNCPPAISDHL